MSEPAAANARPHNVRWERYPLAGQSPQARAWLTIQADLGLARNTIEAYARAVEDYLRFSARCGVAPDAATRAHVAAYVRDLATRPNPYGAQMRALEVGDVDPAHRLLRVRSETTKNRQERVVPYSEATGELYGAYLGHRRELSRERGRNSRRTRRAVYA